MERHTRSFKLYVMDTETIYNSEANEAHVYLWASISTDGDKAHGFDIKSLIEYMSKLKSAIIYFHNLKYDGSYILNYLISNGYTYTQVGGALKKKMFTTIISDMRQFYQIKIRFLTGNLVTIKDSLKIMPASVEALGKAFKLDINKLNIDYRTEAGTVTTEEIEYCYRDCEVVCECLKIMMKQDMNKLTAGACALSQYKDSIGGNKVFERIFPVLPVEIDSYCRRSYKGGFVWVNPRYKNQEILQSGKVFDVNSMFPGVMYYNYLPYGSPVYTETLPKYGTLWIGRVYIGHAKVKNNYIPTIQIKGGRYIDTEYLEEVTDQILTLTNIDYQLMLDHYKISDLRFIDGYCFKKQTGLFKTYIDKWKEVKETNTGALRYIAKLMMNSLYGKFGLNPHRLSLAPILEDGILRFIDDKDEFIAPVYVPMASFITAYARDNIIRNGQKVFRNLCYIDTDSIHMLDGCQIPFEQHPTKLGAYKLESTFDRAKYIRAKTYIEGNGDNIDIKCAGMPEKVKATVKWDDFHEGAVFKGKLQATQVKGGIALIEREFTIRV